MIINWLELASEKILHFSIILHLQGGRDLCSLPGGAQEVEELLVADVCFPPPNITTSGLSSKELCMSLDSSSNPPTKGGLTLPSNLSYLLGFLLERQTLGPQLQYSQLSRCF